MNFLEQQKLRADGKLWREFFVDLGRAAAKCNRCVYGARFSGGCERFLDRLTYRAARKFLEVDGVDVINGNTQAEIDAINAGLFPETAGEVHELLVQDIGAAAPRTVTLTSADISIAAVNRTRIISTPTGDVGYIFLTTFNTFEAEEAIATAISDMAAAGVSDLVLDLRYNGGGFLVVAAQTGYMIAGDAQTDGRIFERLRFNDDAGIFRPNHRRGK